MNLNLDHYRVFYYVVENGNMRKAADALGLAPPTITRIIQELESDLKSQLFLRTRNGVVLTQAGQMLFSHVKPALQTLSAGEKKMNMLANLESGSVTIAVSDVAAQYYLLPVCLPQFQVKYPNISIIIRHLSSNDISNAILAEGADFAVHSSSINSDKVSRLNVVPLNPIQDIAIAGQKYAFLAERKLSLEELAQYPLIFVSQGYNVHSFYQNLYKQHGLDMHIYLESNVVNEQILSAEYGLGYTFVPEICAANGIRRGTLVKLNIDEKILFHRNLSVYLPRGFQQTMAAQAFLDVIFRHFRPL